MNCYKLLAVSLTLLIDGALLLAQEPLTAKQVADQSFKVTKLAGAESEATMTIIDSKGRERVRKIAQVTRLYDNGKTEKKLARFLAPADVKGTGLLTFDYEEKDDDIWLYMPALRKARRIISSEKAKSLMGSEFSYADMTPPSVDDFTFQNLGEEAVNGIMCWKIEMIPINDAVAKEMGFSKKVAFIGKQDFVIRKAIFYDLNNELHKELTVTEIKEVDTQNHRYRPMLMIMVNKQNNRKSIFKIDKIQLNPNLKDEYFTSRYLERE